MCARVEGVAPAPRTRAAWQVVFRHVAESAARCDDVMLCAAARYGSVQAVIDDTPEAQQVAQRVMLKLGVIVDDGGGIAIGNAGAGAGAGAGEEFDLDSDGDMEF